VVYEYATYIISIVQPRKCYLALQSISLSFNEMTSQSKIFAIYNYHKPVPALALGRVGSLPRASQFRGPHSSKKRALQAVDCSV